MQDFRTEAKKELDSIVVRLTADITLLHASRATPALVEDLSVQVYGQRMPLKQVASLSTPDARTIIVQPWDAGVLPEIRKAIESSHLGMSIVPDEKFLRLIMPQLSSERRAEILKVLGKRMEESRIAMRRIRDHAIKTIEEAFRAKEMSEDEKFRQKDALQKVIDAASSTMSDLEKRKVKEIEG